MCEEKLTTILKDIFKHDRFKSEIQENAIKDITKSTFYLLC